VVTPVAVIPPDGTALRRRDLAPVAVPGRRVVRRLRPVLPVVIVAAVFGFLLPRLASYHGVWSGLTSMSWEQTLLVGGVGAANLTASWVMIVVIVPSLRLREAAVLNLGPTAVANTVPAGEAVALGLSWAMLSSWGISIGERVR
jgi:hypothetical protein